jgi:UDP:flavonoid glycosyltransferase YjiC (YdhE family)
VRILFAGYAERTQALPMVPLAWAARCAGHDVLLATQPELVDVAADSGLPVTAVGRSLPLYRLWRHADAAGDADGDAALVDPGRPLDWETASRGYRELVQWWFRTANEPMLDDLVALCREWRPDLVVWETVTFAGAVAARACGARHLRFVWSVDVIATMRERLLAARPPGDGTDPLASWLASCAARAGTDFSESLAVGEATVTFLPAPLRAADSASVRYLPLRFVPYAGQSVVPPWLAGLPPGRRICLTLGTSALERFGRLVVPVGEIVRGASATGAEVLVTLDDPAVAGLADVPPNVRFVGRVPLDALLRHCDLLVSHGGPGTVATAVAAGIPQLVVGEEFDAPVLARLLAATGAAVDLPLGAADAARVRDRVRLLYDDESYRRRALALRDEAAAMPTPQQFVHALETEFMARSDA